MMKYLAGCLIFFSLFSYLPSQEKFRNSPPNPLPLPSLQLPEIQTVVLSNQIRLSTARRPKSRFIRIRLIINTGESLSPDHMPGLAAFTAQILTKGTNELSSSEITQQIEAMGGSLSVETFPDQTVFSLSILNDFMEAAVQMLSHLVLQPAFTRTDIESAKRELYYHINEEDSHSEIRSKKLVYNVLFEHHPYRKFALDREAVKLFSRKDVMMFYEKFYRPNNAHFLVIGDLSLSTASRLISRHFNTWRPAQMDRYSFQFPKPFEKTRICFTDTAGAQNAVVYVGFVLPPKTADTYFPFLVMNQVLGGTHTSRLFMNLRESKRYAYWAFSGMEFYNNCGVFYIRTRVRAEVLKESVAEILKEIKRIKSEKISIQELELAKAYLLGHFPVEMSSPENFADYVTELTFLNLNTPFWKNYFENVMLVNSEMVFEAAETLLENPPVICISGDLDNLVEHMKEFEEIEVYDASGKLKYLLTNR